MGVDLAGNPKNDTGICILTVGDKKSVHTLIVKEDERIIALIESEKPDLVAIDAPLIYSGVNRKCDDMLRQYGALPVTLRGMEVLARRGSGLSDKLGKRFKLIEVFSTASARILGIYDKNDMRAQKMLNSLDLDGDTNTRLMTRDELDSIFAAFTGFLHLVGQTKNVGDETGTVVIPDV